MKKLSAFLLLTTLLLSQLKGAEDAAKKEASVQSIGSVTDPGLLKGLTPIKFLVNTPASSPKAADKVQSQAVEELKKIAQVTFKSFSVQRLAEEPAILKSPFLTYSIKAIQDLNGQSLSLFQVSLICEASSEIAGNDQYGQTLLWGRECFVKEANTSLEAVISKTLPLLLQQFKNSYLTDNKGAKLTFLVPDHS
jgi:hypothetical protein